MSKFYIIRETFIANSAPANRLLSFLKAFDAKNIKATVIFVCPDVMCSKVQEQYNNIDICYLWDKGLFRNRYCSKIFSKYYLRKWAEEHLQKGDKVFLFGSSNLLNYFVRINGIDVYHECTEHPEVVRLRFAYQRVAYLRACTKLKGLFVISTALKKYFQSIGVPEDRIAIVNMTVDIDRFQSLVKQKTETRYIAYCGTASNSKDGVDDLIRSFAIVHKRIPDVKLYIIGKIPSKKENNENIELISKLGLENDIILTGQIAYQEMPQMLKDAEVLVLARPNSLQAENGFPTKLGEYLLTENPVVVTAVGDIPLFLKNGESALLAEERNCDDIAEKICWALTNHEKSSFIGLRGAEIAKIHFNSKTETQKIIEYIQGT